MAVTPKQLQKRIEDSIPLFQQAVNNSIVVSGQDTLQLISRRIFNEGKATDGNKIGDYVEGRYKEEREQAGFQTEYVDLQRRSDLFQSVQTVAKDDTVVIGVINPDSARISDYLEERYNKKIFTASQAEIDHAKETAVEYLKEQVSEIVKGWAK